MLPFADGKKLEKTLGEEAAHIIISLLKRMGDEQKKELATKGHLREAQLRLRKEIETVRKAQLRLETKAEASKSELKNDIASTKHALLKGFIGMAVAQTGVLAALCAIMK